VAQTERRVLQRQLDRRVHRQQRVLRPGEVEVERGEVDEAVLRRQLRPLERQPARQPVAEPQAVPHRGDAALGGDGSCRQPPQLAVVGHADPVIGVAGVPARSHRGETLVPPGVPPLAVRLVVQRRVGQLGGVVEQQLEPVRLVHATRHLPAELRPHVDPQRVAFDGDGLGHLVVQASSLLVKRADAGRKPAPKTQGITTCRGK
jgi:hypothetical protein